MSAGTGTPAASRNVSAKSSVRDEVRRSTLPGFVDARPAHQQRRAQRLLEDPALVEPAVLAEVEALVGRRRRRWCSSASPSSSRYFEQPADALVHRLDAAEVVVHVAVVLPADEVLALRGSPRGTPRCAARSRRPRPCAARASGCGGGVELERRAASSSSSMRHVLVAHRLAAAGVVVEQRRRLGILAVVVVAQVPQAPAPIRGAAPCAGTSAGTASTCRGSSASRAMRSVMMSVM